MLIQRRYYFTGKTFSPDRCSLGDMTFERLVNIKTVKTLYS